MNGSIDDGLRLPSQRVSLRASETMGKHPSPTPLPRLSRHRQANPDRNQLSLWPETPPTTPAEPEAPPPPRPDPETPTVNSPTKPSLRQNFERYLQDENVPYISVDEAKRALFSGAKLKSFHFVVYRPSGSNYLVWAAQQLRPDDRKDLEQWQAIFGEGFLAVVVKQVGDREFKLRDLLGNVVPLQQD